VVSKLFLKKGPILNKKNFCEKSGKKTERLNRQHFEADDEKRFCSGARIFFFAVAGAAGNKLERSSLENCLILF